MKTVCEKNKCTGCMLCKDICPKNAITVKEDMKAYNAVINEELCINCNLCHRMCQKNNEQVFVETKMCKQGWAIDPLIRKKSSSGGLAAAFSIAFIENGGYVCSCTFKDGAFKFELINNKKDISKMTGSKYVKSNATGIYKNIKKLIVDGQKVLFIGLPCQVSALKKYIGENNNLYTVDLICHGTPSPKTLELYLKENKCDIKSLSNLQFRENNEFKLYNSSKPIEPDGVTDFYTDTFLKCVNYTENCYECEYAQVKRVSDITLGDSWGTELSVDEQNKGISLIMCQTQRGMNLLEKSNVHLEDVNIERAIANNRQLNKPSKAPAERDLFFKTLEETGSYAKAFKKLYFKSYYKYKIKKLLIKIGLWK